MATSKNKLEFELRLKDLATQALRNMGATVKKETQKADTAFRRMAGGGMAKALKGFGKLAAATFGVMSVVSAIRLFSMAVRRGVQDAVKFSLAMAEVSTISQEATDNLPMLSQQVLNLSTQFGLQETDAAKALYQTISSGFVDVSQAMGILDSAVVLSVGGLADLRETVDLLTNTLNAYGMEAEESGRLTNIFFETVRLGKTTIPEMTTQLGLVTPIAANLGITIQELTAMLAALTKGGINTQIATTYMRAALVQVLNVSTDARELLGRKGLAGAFSAANLRANGFLDTLKKVKDKIGDNVEEMRILFPNIRALVPILALTGNQMDDFGDILKEISTITSRQVTPAMDALDRVMMSSGKKWQVVTNAVRQGFMELGSGIIETVTGPIGSVEDLGNMATMVREAIAGLKPVVNMMISLMMALGGIFIKIFGALVEVASKFSETLGLSARAIGELRSSAEGLETVGDFLLVGAKTAMFGDAAGAVQELSDKLRDQKLALIDDGLALRDFQAIVGDTSDFTGFHDLAKEWVDVPFDEIPEGIIAAISASKPVFKSALKRWTDDARLEAKLMSMTLAEATTAMFGMQGRTGFKEKWVPNMIAGAFQGSEQELAIQMARIESLLGRSLQSRKVEEAMRTTGEELVNAAISAFSVDALREAIDVDALAGFLGLTVLEIDAMLGQVTDMEGLTGFAKAVGLDPSQLSTQVAVYFKDFHDALKSESPELEAAMKPAFISAWNTFREIGAKAFQGVFDPMGAETTEILDLLTGKWRTMFDELFKNVDLSVFEGLDSSFTSMDEALKVLGLDMRMLEYSAGGANARIVEMQHVQDLAKLSLQGLDRKTVEYAETKQELAKAAFSESVYALYAEIAAQREAGKTLAELAPKYETLRDLIIASADATDRLGNATIKGLEPMKTMWERIGQTSLRLEELKVKAIEAFGAGVANAMMDAAQGAKSFGDSMKDVFRSILVLIGQTIAQLYVMKAIEATGLFPVPAAAGAQGLVATGGFSDPVPLATGGVIAGGLGRVLPLRAYASGGIISGPHVALMGEGGRDEAILPLERMAGGDLGVKAGGGGATNVNISINAVDAKGVDELLVSRQDTLRNIIRQAMTESRAFRSTMLGQTAG